MNQKYLLSVIIPTKNREEYAIMAVEQILGIECDELQVIVQDNSITDSLSNSIKIFSFDKRLKYNRVHKEISFVENFSIAISLADGEYLCLIGDDDGVLPQIIDAVRWAKNNNIDALRPEMSIVYFWPKSTAIKNKPDNGYLHIGKMEISATVFEPKYEVIKLIQRGCIDYLSLEMVKLYHGIIRRSCMDNVYNKIGKYFGGLSPDIYSSVALSLTTKKVIKLGFPLTISGICNQSGSADSANGKHKGKFENAPHFRGHINYEWSSQVPKIYSVETIWADSSLAAIKDLGRSDLLKEFDRKALIVDCLFKYPEYRKEILSSYFSEESRTLRSRGVILIDQVKYFLKYFTMRVFRRLTLFLDTSIKVQGVMNIKDAIQLLSNNYSDRIWNGSALNISRNNRKDL